MRLHKFVLHSLFLLAEVSSTAFAYNETLFPFLGPNDGKAIVMIEHHMNQCAKMIYDFQAAMELPAITGSKKLCVNGFAEGYPCLNVNLLSFMNLATLNSAHGYPDDLANHANDVWGWTH